MRITLRWAARLVAITLAAAGLAAPSQAALASYEGFGYGAGSLLQGQAGGSGWAGSWSTGNPLATISASGLGYGSLATTAGAATASARPNPTGADITYEERQLASGFGADGTSAYLSFLLRPEAGAGFYGGLNFGNLFIGQSGTTSTYGLESAGGNIASSSVVAQTAATVFLVLHVQFQAGNDLIELFVNPTLGAALPGTADALMNNLDLAGSAVTINNASGWTTDEIRLGDSFAAVAPTALPEPSGLLLLVSGLGLLGLVQRRR